MAFHSFNFYTRNLKDMFTFLISNYKFALYKLSLIFFTVKPI